MNIEIKPKSLDSQYNTSERICSVAVAAPRSRRQREAPATPSIATPAHFPVPVLPLLCLYPWSTRCLSNVVTPHRQAQRQTGNREAAFRRTSERACPHHRRRIVPAVRGVLAGRWHVESFPFHQTPFCRVVRPQTQFYDATRIESLSSFLVMNCFSRLPSPTHTVQ
ncbi:hypothetical protein Cob_v004427 [Colletotrichum orbiculare MAFF 240422]|uniref:Uncharacterized protein n=1 Tax=Colletotrichum orbiculare (strain 104-T / ATCC 96160 / CBS 514.97 / LARS 414 / MAFF 240422) TaxID=1213857 RepID=A0A484FYE1_COLOR|nr:hypothetical protein Cob_v004427 [Colletotrichum orbiculare MAFF 240422]